MDYYKKYLKYKEKYLKLKSLTGGFTYDLADEKQIESARRAMILNGVPPEKIEEQLSVLRIKAQKKGSDKVIGVKAALSNLNELRQNMYSVKGKLIDDKPLISNLPEKNLPKLDDE